MRDIRKVLERWGTWAADNHETVCWYSRAPGIGRLMRSPSCRLRPSCSDDDGMKVSYWMAQLSNTYPESYDLLFEYYLLNCTLAKMAYSRACSIPHVSRLLQRAEGVMDGIMFGAGVVLEMEKELSC